jgi:ligand-binding SRPBCC domain-containing protein
MVGAVYLTVSRIGEVVSTTLSFESTLAASPEKVWAWITSFDGISKEMAPVLQMSAPKGERDIASISFEPGVPMFRSWITLGGVLPIDFSDLTLLSLTPGVGFVEQSRMGSMRQWRHERTIFPVESGCRVTDTLTIEPRFGGRLAVALVRKFFTHRHNMLRKHLGVYAANHSLQARLP